MPEPLRRAGEALWEGALYTISMPERYLRGLTALLGGMLKETTDLVVPDFVKDTTSYNLFVGNILRFAVENVGGVEGVYDDEGLSGDYATRKLLGNAIEGIGVATVHLSPLWVFAFFADSVKGGQAYLNRLHGELVAKGGVGNLFAQSLERTVPVPSRLRHPRYAQGARLFLTHDAPVRVHGLSRDEEVASGIGLEQFSGSLDLLRLVPGVVENHVPLAPFEGGHVAVAVSDQALDVGEQAGVGAATVEQGERVAARARVLDLVRTDEAGAAKDKDAERSQRLACRACPPRFGHGLFRVGAAPRGARGD